MRRSEAARSTRRRNGSPDTSVSIVAADALQIDNQPMRSAPREALDPGQGEAMLGQALHEKPALRFSECSGQDSAELLIFPKG